MKHCFAYTRVSTVKQGDGVSLEAQKEAIQAFAERHNLEIVKWFEERETAAKKGRPVFNRMLKELQRGPTRGLVMHKIDRSARNFADWAKIGDLADAGVDIHFATESLDFRSRGGRLTADIQAVIAADYIRNLRDETLKGIRGRLKQGLYPFRAPIGYLDQGKGKPKIPDPKKAPLIKEMFERYAGGEASYDSLRQHMHQAGLRNLQGGPVTMTGIETILNNPFYCGLIRIKSRGETYPGIHEPIITPALFAAVQDVKAGRRAVKVMTRHRHTFRSLFRCQHCQTAAIPERQKGYVYYRCHTRGCVTKTVREEAIDAAIQTALLGVRIPPATEDRAKTTLARYLRTDLQQLAHNPVPMELAKIDSRLERLTDALIDGLIDKAQFETKKEKLVIERLALEQKQAEQSQQRSLSEHDFTQFLELIKSLHLTYEIALPEEKRQIAKLTTSNRIVSGRNAYAEPQSWLAGAVQVVHDLSGDPSHASSRSIHEVTNGHVNQLTELISSNQVQSISEISQLPS